MEAEDGAILRYWRLACETIDYLQNAHGWPSSSIWVDVDEAKQAIRSVSSTIVCERSNALIQRWHDWDAEFQIIESSSPKWRLKQMIIQVSESHARLSWPKRWERVIWEWALSPEGSTDFHFVDYDDIFDDDFHSRLRGLVLECDGFLYRCEESHHIVFAPTDQLAAVWRHQDHLAAIDRDKRFGFFNDVLRPDWHEVGREPTEEELRMIKATSQRPRPVGRWRRVLRRITG